MFQLKLSTFFSDGVLGVCVLAELHTRLFTNFLVGHLTVYGDFVFVGVFSFPFSYIQGLHNFF